MLPAVASTRTTAVRMIGYTVVLWGLSVLFSAVGEMGLVYLVSAVVLGAVFLFYAVQVLRTQATASAMRLFSYSITYITLLFAAMAVDQVVRTGV